MVWTVLFYNGSRGNAIWKVETKAFGTKETKYDMGNILSNIQISHIFVPYRLEIASRKQLRRKEEFLPSCWSLIICQFIWLLTCVSRYDVSGVPADQIQRILQQDWIHLVRNKGVLNSPNYLKEKGKPVISLWGMLYLVS
jgi:hypothetical protein